MQAVAFGVQRLQGGRPSTSDDLRACHEQHAATDYDATQFTLHGVAVAMDFAPFASRKHDGAVMSVDVR